MHEGWGWNVACRPVFENGLVYLTTGVSKRILAVRPDGTGDVTETHTVWDARGRASENPSPLLVDGLLFMVSDSGGFVTCIDAMSGERVWRERFPAGGTYWASPLYADGKIYFSSMEGVVSVIAATRGFQLLAENRFGSDPEKKGASAEKGKGAAGKKNLPGTAEEKENLIEKMRAKGMSDAEIKEWFAGAVDEYDNSGGGKSGAGFAASPAVAGNAILLRSDTHLYCIGR
jgi:outer membrane protein assembly factor BamB